tara:strand:+ start:41 stop:1393 length:1353 start_codon:yes stop_codon:yes gene_type:complete
MTIYSDGLAKLRENLEWFLQSGVATSIIGKTKEPVSIEKPKGIVARPEKIYVPEEEDDENTILDKLKEHTKDNWGKIFAESSAAAIESASTKKNKKDKIVILDETMSKIKPDNKVAPTNEIGLDVEVKEIEEATTLSGFSPTYLVGDRQAFVQPPAGFQDMTGINDDFSTLVGPEVGVQDPSGITVDTGLTGGLEALGTSLSSTSISEPEERDIPEGRGINKRASDFVYEVQGSVFTNDVLGPNEGVVSGDVVTGLTTAEYGVQDSLGLKRENYTSNKAFAAAVVEKHYEAIDEQFEKGGHNLKSMPKEVQYAFLDLHYNNRSGLGNDTVTYFDPKDMKKSLNNTLEFVGTRTSTGTKILLPSLASRRVNMYNEAVKGLGKRNDTINSIEITKEDSEFGNTNLVQYRDVWGNIVHSFTNSRTLANVSSTGASIERNSATWNKQNNEWSYE